MDTNYSFLLPLQDNDLPYGQHRWVEYANIHDPDPTMIAPEWHGWMHHVFDETPNEAADYSLASDYAPAVAASHAIYRTHLGHHATSESNDHAQYNVSQYRQRGYNVGSLMTEPGEPDAYYKQPGHPLSADVQKGRFTHEKASKDAWNPQEELRKLKEKK